MPLAISKKKLAARWSNRATIIVKISTAPQWLPVLIGIGISTATLFVWQALIAQERTQVEQIIAIESSAVNNEITAHLKTRVNALQRMTKRWEIRGGTPKREWESDAIQYINDFGGFQAIEWLDPTFHVRWIVPLAGNEAALNLNLSRESRRRVALEAARNRREVTGTRSINLSQGGKGFLIYVPIFQGEDFRGFILGVFRVQELLDTILKEDENIKRGYSITVSDGEEEIYSRNVASRQYSKEWGQETKINLYDGATWRIRIWPTPELLAKEQSPFPQVVLFGGLLLAWLLALTVHLAQQAYQKQQQAEGSNRELEKEITSRQQAEEELRESKRFAQSVTEHSTSIIYVFDLDTMTYAYTNKDVATFLGYGLEQIQVMGADFLSSIIHPDDLPYMMQHLKDFQNVLDGEVIEFEQRVKHASGEWRWLWNRETVFKRRADGSPCQIMGTAQDITIRNIAENALKESEQRFRSMADTAPVLLWITDPDGRCTYVNQPWLCFTGRTLEQEIGFGWMEGVPTDDLERCNSLFQEAFAVQEPLWIEHRLRHHTGEYRWILVSRTPRYVSTEFAGYIGSCVDITKRKQTEAALIQSEERFKAFMNNSPAVAFMKDEEGRFIYVNQPLERCFNIKMDDWLGKTDFDIWPEELALQFRKNDRTVLAADKTLEIVEVVPSPDGHLRHWLSFKFPGKDISGRRLVGGIAIDITERLQAQEALQQANDKLSGWVNELEQRHHEIAQLGKLSDFLQACKSVEEAYTALEQLVPPLFPQTNGGIFLINDSKNLVEAVATWGLPFPSQEMFAPDECWALRRGRTYHTADVHSKLRCSHIHSDSSPTSSLCIPMMAQGKAMGVLCLSWLELGELIENKQQLAVTVADHIALSLANLKLRETLQNQSIRDSLTGLFNRRYLEESLERELHRSARNQQSLGIIMLDVDHFKQFNDTFGHLAGDAVLRELGQFLQSHVRKSDIACRYGGEELILILPEASLEIVLERAQAIRERVKHLQVQHRHQLLGTITLSLGVAMFPEHGLTVEAVLQAADAALYRAKQLGRDRVCANSDSTSTTLIVDSDSACYQSFC